MSEDNVVTLKPAEDGSAVRVISLIPQERLALFSYQRDDNAWRACFLLREDGTLEHHQVSHCLPGGWIKQIQPCDEPPPERALAQAKRMVKGEFDTWDSLRILDRLHLQKAWALDTLTEAEFDLEKMITMPFDEHEREGLGRWSLGAFQAQINSMKDIEGEIVGLETAINSL